MANNLNVDDRLNGLALQLGSHKTKRDAVNAALAEHVDHLQRVEALKDLGTFDFDDDYDHKQARSAS